jgi:hypothetical protein
MSGLSLAAKCWLAGTGYSGGRQSDLVIMIERPKFFLGLVDLGFAGSERWLHHSGHGRT